MQIVCKILEIVCEPFFGERSIVSVKFSEGPVILYLPTPKVWSLSEKPLGRGAAFSKVLGHTVSPSREESQRCPSWLGSLTEKFRMRLSFYL